ncbi:hypothetical protein G7046_g286 [Stylonectria norvegica]|nr:hypothetical protein G7046_g286 [Stylonectria norvegica]
MCSSSFQLPGSRSSPSARAVDPRMSYSHWGALLLESWANIDEDLGWEPRGVDELVNKRSHAKGPGQQAYVLQKTSPSKPDSSDMLQTYRSSEVELMWRLRVQSSALRAGLFWELSRQSTRRLPLSQQFEALGSGQSTPSKATSPRTASNASNAREIIFITLAGLISVAIACQRSTVLPLSDKIRQLRPLVGSVLYLAVPSGTCSPARPPRSRLLCPTRRLLARCSPITTPRRS